MTTPKQITVDVTLLEAVIQLPNLPEELAQRVRYELSQKENVDREIRRLSMRLDALMPAPNRWPENMEQVSAAFRGQTGPNLMREIATALEWISSPTWVTRCARFALAASAGTGATDMAATQQELAEYERLFAWRKRWGSLASKLEPGRLQSRQERIERRAVHCNQKILALMRSYDARVGNNLNPV